MFPTVLTQPSVSIIFPSLRPSVRRGHSRSPEGSGDSEHPAGSPAHLGPPPCIYDLIKVTTSQSSLFPGFFCPVNTWNEITQKKKIQSQALILSIFRAAQSDYISYHPNTSICYTTNCSIPNLRPTSHLLIQKKYKKGQPCLQPYMLGINSKRNFTSSLFFFWLSACQKYWECLMLLIKILIPHTALTEVLMQGDVDY